MITTAPATSSFQSRTFFVRRKAPWDVLASFVAYGFVVIVACYWFRMTNDTSAAYKSYHLAKVGFGLGRATVDDACAASRRCCIAQCRVPRSGKSEPLQAHLTRIGALRPVMTASTAGEKSAAQHAIEVWQTYRDEAALWVKLEKPK